MTEEEKQPFLSHLEELRKRLIRSVIGIGIGFIVCYAFRKQLFGILIQPLMDNLPEGDKLIFTNLPEMFFAYLKTAAVGGIIFTSPFIFYQVWMFIAPGLYQKERRLAGPFVFFSTLLFVGGALFGYFIVFPFGFRFFLGFANESIQALPTVKQYFSFAVKLLLAFGVIFELPVIIFFLAKIGLVSTEFLKKQRKYAIFLTFVIAAILTPPDIITQCMMAVPLILLYEIGIFVSRFARQAKVEEEETVEAEEESSK